MSEKAAGPPRVDYDTIAALYDEPLRDHVVDPHLVAFVEARRATTRPVSRILDVGCGTGKQIAANWQRFPDLPMVGLDRFQGMLRIARARCPAAHWLQADAATMPLADKCLDYVSSQFSYQHIRRTGHLLREVFRVLRPGGQFVMTNIDPWSMQRWLVYEYFPEAFELDRRDFVEVDTFVALMQHAGFHGIRVGRADVSRVERLREFLTYASGRHRASQLLAIPDHAYAAGMRRLEADAAAGDAAIRSEFVLVTVVGNRSE